MISKKYIKVLCICIYITMIYCKRLKGIVPLSSHCLTFLYPPPHPPLLHLNNLLTMSIIASPCFFHSFCNYEFTCFLPDQQICCRVFITTQQALGSSLLGFESSIRTFILASLHCGREVILQDQWVESRTTAIGRLWYCSLWLKKKILKNGLLCFHLGILETHERIYFLAP